MVWDWVKWEQNEVLLNSEHLLSSFRAAKWKGMCIHVRGKHGRTRTPPCCVLLLWALLYLVVALGVEAVVMFSVLVGAVYVSTVLTAREPANRREGETINHCPGSNACKQSTNKLSPVPAFSSHVYGIKPHLLYPFQGWWPLCLPLLICHYLKVLLEPDHSGPVHP